MDYTHKVTYDATAAEVFAMLADPAFREAVAAAQDVVSAEVTISPTNIGEGMKVVIDQLQRTAGVPSFAKKIVGETTRAVQREDWTSAREADFAVDTPGAPMAITGSLRLVEHDGRTTQTHDVRIKASVPLIGGKLEKLTAELFAEGRDQEQAVGAAWLARTDRSTP